MRGQASSKGPIFVVGILEAAINVALWLNGKGRFQIIIRGHAVFIWPADFAEPIRESAGLPHFGHPSFWLLARN